MLTLASCGPVTGTSPVVVVGDLLVLPAAADMFPDLPTQFTISGGTPAYSVFSSNNLVLPLDSAVNGTTFFAIPKSVAVDTKVTITVRDANNKTKDVTVTVKPAVISNNDVTFSVLAPAGTGCGTNALCSGGTAQVVVTALLNGAVLPNRPIRFDAYQGDFQLVTPGTGLLVNSITVNTDERGEAVIRLTAAAGARPQVATLTATDVSSGLVRRFSFNIVPRTLSTLPSSNVTFIGNKGPIGGGAGSGLCPVGRVDYYIFGGAPPYAVASPLPGLASVTPSVVTTSGGSFTANLAGCGSVAFIVTDSAQQSVETALLIGKQGPDGSDPVVVTPPATTIPVVSPSTMTFPAPPVGCTQMATVSLSGTGSWTGSIGTPGGNPGISITPTTGTLPQTVTVTRTPNPALPLPGFPATPATVLVNFGNSAGTGVLTVTTGGGNCP